MILNQKRILVFDILIADKGVYLLYQIGSCLDSRNIVFNWN